MNSKYFLMNSGRLLHYSNFSFIVSLPRACICKQKSFTSKSLPYYPRKTAVHQYRCNTLGSLTCYLESLTLLQTYTEYNLFEVTNQQLKMKTIENNLFTFESRFIFDILQKYSKTTT